MKKSILHAAGILLLGIVSPLQAKTLDELRACVKENFPQRSFQQDFRLIAQDPGGGERELVAVLYGAEQKAERVSMMLSVLAPQDLQGARYLLLEKKSRDDMYVYLPALQRTRRIMGGMRGQSLWGTDFSYEDIRQLQGIMVHSQAELLSSQAQERRMIHQVSVTPAPEEESPYQKIEIDVDDATCLVLKTRFYDQAGLLKRLEADAETFRKLDDKRWVFGTITMDNLRSKTRSILHLDEVVYDEKLASSLFNPKTFHVAQ